MLMFWPLRGRGMPMMVPTPNKVQIDRFRARVWQYFRRHPRSFPWRATANPYAILVSEVMLQQTQTSRVIPFYHRFLERFPTVSALARGRPQEVLALWSGLGYNRRALALHACAREVVERFQGTIPDGREALLSLPGVGSYTAAAVRNFAFSLATPMIETNIRTVYLDAFVSTRQQVKDDDLLPLVCLTMSQRRPREWFYALMDYGVYLKSIGRSHHARSASVTRQSPFKGSLREVRGAIIRHLVGAPRPIDELMKLPFPADRITKVLQGLCQEGMVKISRGIARV